MTDLEDDAISHLLPLDEISERFQKALSKEFKNEPNIKVQKGFTFYWLNEEDTNCDQCIKCGNLTSNIGKPNVVPVLKEGTSENGKLICNECRSYK